MRMPEFPALRALPTLPAAGWNGAADGSFTQAMRAAQAEIAGIVRNGWPEGALPALNAEGMARRAALQRLYEGAAQAPDGAAQEAGASAPAQQAFLAGIAPWAREAGATLGVAPELVAAHAALESGWGQRPLRAADGSDSHNLFGIKAAGGWQGARVQAQTTEYEDGEAYGTQEMFRAYPDQASAFRDYARLLQTNPRYQGALNTGADARAFAQALASGGYATDPAYAAKLTRLATQLQARTQVQTPAPQPPADGARR